MLRVKEGYVSLSLGGDVNVTGNVDFSDNDSKSGVSSISHSFAPLGAHVA